MQDRKSNLERIIMKRFEVSTVAVARTEEQLEKLLAANPFRHARGRQRSGFDADQLHLCEAEAYMRFKGNSHTSRLGNAFIERRLKVSAGARNVRTLERLLQLPRD